MVTLFLDFASNAKHMAIVDNMKVSVQPLLDHTDETATLPLIAKLSPLKEIDRIVATIGPGGFMSLRVGLSIANALSWSLKIPIAGVHLSDLWYARATNDKLQTTNCFWLHSTKKAFLFVRGFGTFSKKWPEPVLMKLDDARELLPKGTSFVGELIPEQSEILGLKPFEGAEKIETILPTLLKHLSYGISPLLPWYGREP